MTTFRRKTVGLVTMRVTSPGQKSSKGTGRGFILPNELMLVADVLPIEYTAPHAWLDLSDWRSLAQAMAEAYPHVDGFVVLHPTPTISSGAAALSCLLQNLEKPVIMIGDDESRPNLVNAFQAAVSDVAEVVVLHKLLLLRGQVVDQHAAGKDIILSGVVLGKVDFGIRLFGKQIRRQRRAFRLADHFISGMTTLTVMPGVTSDQLLPQLGHSPFVWINVLGVDPGLMAMVKNAVSSLPKVQRVFLNGIDQLTGEWPKTFFHVVGPSGPMMIRAMWISATKQPVPTVRKFLITEGGK